MSNGELKTGGLLFPVEETLEHVVIELRRIADALETIASATDNDE